MYAALNFSLTPIDAYASGLFDRLKGDHKGLFGSREIKSTKLSSFKKWATVLERQQHDHLLNSYTQQDCKISDRLACSVTDWQKLIKELKDQPLAIKLEKVNRHMNRHPYITDIVNWGVKDYWASVKQFFRRDGDCEDYAIAKYFSLKELGINPDNMRIVVVQDTSLNTPHAVLAVYHQDQILILDNQINYVVKERAVLHYKPLYSINESAWWMHRM